jgi:hypothetical protein
LKLSKPFSWSWNEKKKRKLVVQLSLLMGARLGKRYYYISIVKVAFFLCFVGREHITWECRLRAVPPFRGFRFPGTRKERRDCRQHSKKWNPRCPHNGKFPLVEIDTPVNQIGYVIIRGGPLEIPGGGYNIFAAQIFFQSHVSAGFFLMHLTSARIFFQDYLYFAVCLHGFFFSDVMAAQNFFPGIFLCTNFFGGIFTPHLPGFLMVRPLWYK